jgi:hypothetical protein
MTSSQWKVMQFKVKKPKSSILYLNLGNMYRSYYMRPLLFEDIFDYDCTLRNTPQHHTIKVLQGKEMN